MLHDLFQSTHPSGVRPYSDDAEDLLKVISIHAPQWGATIPQDYINRYGRISIHAPQWGATRNGVSDAAYRCYFNPRTPVGCDDRRQGEHHRPGISIHAPQWGATGHGTPTDQQVRISIHAPQWGATILGGLLQQSGVNFNPRTPVGCDAIASAPPLLTTLFQSTHPSGVRRSSVPPPSCVDRYFNPRTPVGCDKIDVYAFLPRLNFNPRTPVGCDSPIPTVAHCCTNFNPRTPVGCDWAG